MPNLGWIITIAAGIVLAVVVIVVVPRVAHRTGRTVGQWIFTYRYRRDAKKTNEAARLKRLEATTYNGWPLPTGKQGTLVITYLQQMDLPAIPTTTFERIYFDRGRDLGVDLQYTVDPLTKDIKVRWKPAKKKNKEVY